MKLIDLNPRWVGLNGRNHFGENSASVKFGLTFACPHCGIRMGVLFRPFMDPDNIALKVEWAIPGAPDPNTGEVKEVLWWDRTGDSFETLTLSPSVNLEGHWHGHITNGLLT